MCFQLALTNQSKRKKKANANSTPEKEVCKKMSPIQAKKECPKTFVNAEA